MKEKIFWGKLKLKKEKSPSGKNLFNGFNKAQRYCRIIVNSLVQMFCKVFQEICTLVDRKDRFIRKLFAFVGSATWSKESFGDPVLLTKIKAAKLIKKDCLVL